MCLDFYKWPLSSNLLLTQIHLVLRNLLWNSQMCFARYGEVLLAKIFHSLLFYATCPCIVSHKYLWTVHSTLVLCTAISASLLWSLVIACGRRPWEEFACMANPIHLSLSVRITLRAWRSVLDSVCHHEISVLSFCLIANDKENRTPTIVLPFEQNAQRSWK